MRPHHDQAAIRDCARRPRCRARSRRRRARRPESTPRRTTAPRSGSRQTRRTRRAPTGSRMTATRVTPGAISLSSSSHFPLMLNSNEVNPVALPPGRARLSTQPPPTGSIVVTNTIGTVRLACCNAPTIDAAWPGSTSGASATNSAAYLRKRRDRRRPSGSRSARCGRRSSPVPPAPARTP